MRHVNPRVFLVAETQIDERAIADYLRNVGGHPDEGGVFSPDEGSKTSSSEQLTEFMGRLCYRSWKPELNPNVTKVREGNDKYLANVIKVKHGSVLEHASASFVFHNVSRVFTHELVRHRAGTAISQESLRYVRLDDLGMWLPQCIREDVSEVLCVNCNGAGSYENESDRGVLATCSECWGKGTVKTHEVFASAFRQAERMQVFLAEHFKLDDPNTDFTKKKEVTSAMRRIAPDGLATTIGWTANMRTLRFVLALRTHRSAEEEIRLVFDEVGTIAQERWPNLFSDFTRTSVNGIGEWTSENWKV